jgi:hypothetical protein
MKKILLLTYSQSGQTEELGMSLLKCFNESAAFEVTIEKIRPLNPVPFPWGGYRFFDAFPETFLEEPYPLFPLDCDVNTSYDLIVLAYQPWFLSVSRPVMSFLKSKEAKTLLAGKPVVTILGSRNMWVSAHYKIKKLLADNGALLKGHIALADRHSNLVSLITILAWLIAGKREKFAGIFPRAGISVEDVNQVNRFGKPLLECVESGDYSDLQNKWLTLGAVTIKPNLLMMEQRGAKSFGAFARWIRRAGKEGDKSRKWRVYTFMYLLPAAIVVLTPITFFLKIIVLQIRRKSLEAEIEKIKKV